MKRILIPTDFSESASKASDLALQIAKKLNLGVTFLHLVSTPVEWKKIPLEKEELYPETKAAIGDAKDSLCKLERTAANMGVDTSTSLVFNTGIEEIQRYINKENYQLVVMGTHGTHGIDKMAGTNTYKVINRSPVPVLALKATDKATIPENWVITSDFEEESEAGIHRLLELASSLGASVQALYVNTPYKFVESPAIEEKMDRALARFSDIAIRKKVISAYNEEKGIRTFLKTCECDLVAIVTHGKYGFTSLFRRHITEELINHLEIPILSMNLRP